MARLKEAETCVLRAHEYRADFKHHRLKWNTWCTRSFHFQNRSAIVTDFENGFNWTYGNHKVFLMKNRFEFSASHCCDYCSNDTRTSERCAHSLCSFILTWKQLSKWQKNGVYNLFANLKWEQAQCTVCTSNVFVLSCFPIAYVCSLFAQEHNCGL